MNFANFFAELKRRNVYKVAVAYAVVGWLVVQVTTQVFPIFEIPNWALRLIVLAIVIGFPIALGVAHVVEGSVQRAANKIRVNAQLIDARTDAHLWAQTYDRDLVDVFAIQSEIAKAIADQLQAKLSPNEKKAIEQPPTTDLAAF